MQETVPSNKKKQNLALSFEFFSLFFLIKLINLKFFGMIF